MMALPVSGSWPTVYRPSQRPSLRFRMFPSPFARLFGIKSASFVTAHNTVKGREKLLEIHSIIRKLSIPSRRLSLFRAYQDLSCYGDFHRLQLHKTYRFCIKAPLQTVVTRGFAATFLKFSVKPFWEPRKKRQFPKPANPCGSSHCGLL